jgi:uncharacterized protein YacL
MSDITFLIDENVLGLDRYLSSLDIKFKKIGDEGCPQKTSDDPTVAKFAQKNKLVVITNDENLKKQCDIIDVEYVFMDLRDFARKVKNYAESH